MNIWKIASRWSNNGEAESSILDIFKTHQIVFAGRKTERIQNEVKIGDLIALSDGLDVIAIGKVLGEPKPITEFENQINFSEREIKRFDYEDWVIGFKVKLIFLHDNEIFTYNQGTFHRVHGEYYDTVLKLYKSHFNKAATNNFSINAKTCTLKYNDQQDQDVMFNGETKYIIPIYQRPYSWREDQIRKLLSDIFLSYWGVDKVVNEEPMFIGTMQLTQKSKSYFGDYSNQQEVVDGQQRLTTFLILLKVLKSHYPTCQELDAIQLNWLKTEVNNNTQQELLDELLESDLSFDQGNPLNRYWQNAQLIKEIFEEELPEGDNGKSIDIDSFVKHLLSNIYFVVIETKAGLSKTLQIFDAINTTGLDLNGGDIFKIRMYEYLRDKNDESKEVFNRISELYKKIEDYNREFGWKVTDIAGVLSIYQKILVAKHNLPVVLYALGSNTFFERMFDTLLNINQWDSFSKLGDLRLSLDDLNDIVEVRYEWQRSRYHTAEDACALHQIWWSRYGRYWDLIFVFLYKFKEDENRLHLMQAFVRKLSKLYSLYSILFQKSIGNIRTFSNNLSQEILKGDFNSIIEIIDKKFMEDALYKGDSRNALRYTLERDIIYNVKMKNIICRISAMLEEDYMTVDIEKINGLRKKLFDLPIDIEHIQSYNDENIEERDQIKNEWGYNLNSIGNLMVLESDINRSISNKPYFEKTKRYLQSTYGIAKNQPNDYPVWNLEKCKERKQKEISKIINYIFDDEDQVKDIPDFVQVALES
ncbi:DUF262 domain-containing protein [Ancylomarina longa]|uniref:DUF262 domain-containing protein n=1 Tax=Ancylomarina longa TaxID=2487017 RepID=A0A434AWP5_9BACT|nr:DUF262 domain-containing protein [Ancylomarina longa]RUT78948.1 DUF262 domain-containing protein [Ancylomarina longa]